MDGTYGFGQPWNVFVDGGGVNIYFYRLGTATNVFSMEDIDNFRREGNKKGAFPKNSIIFVFKTLSSGTSANP